MNVEKLNGTVERVTFYSEQTGFCVLKVKVPKLRDFITVVGMGSEVYSGEYINCVGNWQNNQEYGLQFRADEINTVKPQTKQGIEKYLRSGLIKGIGPGFSKRLVDCFGERVFEIIEQNPKQLKRISGLGRKRIEQITRDWEDQKVIREIVVFLQMNGMGTAHAVRVHRTYGQKAIIKIQSDPYCLALDIRGIGFKSADQLAMKLGRPKDSILRVKAGIHHVLQENVSAGHCAIEVKKLQEQASILLEVTDDLIIKAIEQEVSSKRFIQESIDDNPSLFLSSLYHMECRVVAELNRLSQVKASFLEGLNSEKSIEWVERITKMKLSRSQKIALSHVLSQKVSIITGGPGVGKTTLINSILKILSKRTRHILLCAPTGRAAKRLSESTNREAKTLHRLLEYNPKTYGFIRDEKTPLHAEYIVVDEASMVDLKMMQCFLKAIPDQCGVLFVGDVDQLPSVGAGRVLSDLIQSNVIPTVRLTEIFRQAAQSKIILNAHRVNLGKMPILEQDTKKLSDFYFISAETPEQTQQKLCVLLKERIPKRFGFDPLTEIQVLSPMNRGGLGVRALNVFLQAQLNKAQQNSITRFGWTFSQQDKVIQTVNNYDKEVFNGDIGFIDHIDKEAQKLTIMFDYRIVAYDFSELDEITLAYATSIHKSQGSEYPAVIIPLSMQHYMLLEKNLLYTAITRGRKLVVLLGQKKALRLAVGRERSQKRLTNLVQRIREEVAI